jgi:hypothetical protein
MSLFLSKINQLIMGCVALGFLISLPCFALVPPSYYWADRISKKRAGLETAILQYELFEQAGTPEKPLLNKLTNGNFFYVSARSVAPKDNKVWPLPALLLEPEATRLMASLRAFGLPMNREEDLVNRRPKNNTSRSNNPNPDFIFYKREDSLSVKRWGDRLAWQITDVNRSRRLLVEKDSFTILALQAPCPEAFKASAVGNNGPICSLEFRYEVNSSMQVPSSVSLKIDSRELMVLKINRVLLNPAEKLVRELTKATPNDTSDANAAFAKNFTSAFLQ